MHPIDMRTDRVTLHDQHRRVLATAIDVLPRVSAGTETLAYYLLVSAFWGIVLYVALTFALN